MKSFLLPVSICNMLQDPTSLCHLYRLYPDDLAVKLRSLNLLHSSHPRACRSHRQSHIITLGSVHRVFGRPCITCNCKMADW